MIYRSFLEKEIPALKGVSLEIEHGELFTLLGPNGAGKTTLISVLSTILIPTKGEVRILGMDARKDTRKIRKRINIASGTRLPWGMRVYEVLRFYALSYGIFDKSVVEKALKDFELEKYRDLRFDELSAGNRQKLNLARAFINNPELVFLDEPTANLDPDIAKKVREMILMLKEEREITVVLTTHNMKEAEILSERIAFIKDGRIVAEGTPEDLKKLVKSRDRIILRINNLRNRTLQIKLPHEIDGNKLIVYSEKPEKDLPEVIYHLRKNGFEIDSVKSEEVSLEDVFIELAG